jgi:2-polyprenyl-3-methyl-5-hydroxy-6-metoxy-1,4-benzoquinol methylase
MLSVRSTLPELMDGERQDFATTDRALRELETINRLTLAYGPTLQWLDVVAQRCQAKPISLLDVGCGHGDMLRRIWEWARKRGIAVTLTGIDANPLAIRSATAATPRDVPITYEARDVFSLEGEPFDVIVSSLFAHHLSDETLVRFLAWMDASARLSWLVSDLHRHALPHAFVRGWVGIAGFGRFVVHDAPISVARGFTRGELVAAVRQAGIDPRRVEISWRLPFRYRVACLK